MWVSALLPSFVWQLLCSAIIQCHLCHSDLTKHGLCKTFSSRPGPSLDSYVSALHIPEDLLHLVQGLNSLYLYQRGEKRVWFDQSHSSGVCLAVAPTVPGYQQDQLWAAQEWAVGIADTWAGEEQCLRSSAREEWADHAPHRHSEMVHWNSECFRLLQANPCTWGRSQDPAWRVWCLLLTSTNARGCYPMLDCPLHRLLHQIFPWGILTQQDTRGVCIFGIGARFPKSSLEITSWSTPQGLLFQAAIPFHIVLKSTPQFWRSVCPDPVRAIPSLYLF